MIPFSPPYINDKVIEEVTASLRSGWITTGPKVKLLEEEISKYIDVPNVLCVNSWTSGAIMILKWLGLKEGDEVIIPAYTYSATALAVIHAGGKPIMIDVGPDFNMDIDKIEGAINSKTKAIIPVDFSGYPCNYKEILKIITAKQSVSKFNPTSEIQQQLGRILILSDAAHSLGATYDNRKMGGDPDVTIFSLHAVKNITTAEGGAIVLNLPAPFSNNSLYATLKMMTLNCQTKDAFSKSKGGNWQYDIVGLGMKINMADVNAAIGLAQIREYESLLNRRIGIFERYLEGFKDYEWFIPPPMKADGIESSCHLFPLRIGSITESDRNKIIDEITTLGVSVNVHFIPLPMLTFFKAQGFKIEEYPMTYKNFASEISLPIYPQLSDADVDYIIKTVVKSYSKVMVK